MFFSDLCSWNTVIQTLNHVGLQVLQGYTSLVQKVYIPENQTDTGGKKNTGIYGLLS